GAGAGAGGGAVPGSAEARPAEPRAVIKNLAVRFQKALTVPVLEPTKAALAAEAAELYPAKLPPLRADAPTLVVGRFEKGKAPANLELTIHGRLPRVPITANVSHPIPP